MHSGFEQWVRTAKTFLVDHYQETPCLREGAKEGAFMTLTALPFKDYLNVAVGAAASRDPFAQGPTASLAARAVSRHRHSRAPADQGQDPLPGRGGDQDRV